MVDESVSIWIAELKRGDDDAAEKLWDRYFLRLVGLGRRLLRNSSRSTADEEDVALSAFKSLCLRARAGRFPRLNDREDLWKLLITITVRKAIRNSRKSQKFVDEHSFIHEQLASAEPTAEFVVEMESEIESLFSRLRNDGLRQVAQGKLEGLTNKEIAERTGRSISFVERKLQLIRQTWSSEVDDERK